MPQAAVLNLRGEEVCQVELAPALFDVEPNLDLMHQALLYIENQRAHPRGITRTRSEICHSGNKMFRQKGTGRARHGDRSASTFVGGAKAHGPKGARRSLRMPKKMRRQAVAGALTAQYRKGLVRFVNDLRPAEINTRVMAEALESLRCSRGKVIAIVGPAEYYDESLCRSTHNLPRFTLRAAPHFNLRDLLVADHIIVTQGALALLAPGGEADAEHGAV